MTERRNIARISLSPLSNPTNANLGTNAVHTYEIIDDDYEPTTRTVCASGCDYSSIQTAIDEAWEGDTVEVGPGVYAENLDFKGRHITVESTDGANKTKINGGCAGSAVRFVSGEGSDSVLEGFAIENGCAEYGAGIFLDGSSPAISHCQILENRATAGGGGIFAANGASPTFSHFIVQDNYSTGYGGGLAVESSSAPEFADGLIADNHANSHGGGVYIHASSPVVPPDGNRGQLGPAKRRGAFHRRRRGSRDFKKLHTEQPGVPKRRWSACRRRRIARVHQRHFDRQLRRPRGRSILRHPCRDRTENLLLHGRGKHRSLRRERLGRRRIPAGSATASCSTTATNAKSIFSAMQPPTSRIPT